MCRSQQHPRDLLLPFPLTERGGGCCASVFFIVQYCSALIPLFFYSICSQCQQSLKCQTKCDITIKEDERRDGNHIDYHYIQSKPISEDKSNKINTINTRTLRGLLWIQRHFLGNMLIPLLLFLGPGMRNM